MALNSLRQNRNIIYRLKRQRGQTISIRQITGVVNNYETGTVSKTQTITTVRRAIVLPLQDDRIFNYGLTYVAANKNFSYGGYYDSQDRTLIIDRKDINFEITNDFKVRIKGLEYGINKIQSTEDDVAYIATLHRVGSESIDDGGGNVFTNSGDNIFTEDGNDVFTQLGA